MTWSLRDEMRRLAIERLRQIAHEFVINLEYAQLGQVREEVLPELFTTVSRLPFQTDEEIDFEPRHITPYPRESFEQIYNRCFGGDKDTCIEWPPSMGDPPESYPMSTVAFQDSPWPLYEDHITRRNEPPNSMIAKVYTDSFFFLLEAEVQDTPDDHASLASPPRLIDFTNWRGTWLHFSEPSYFYRGGYNDGKKRWSLVDMYNLGQDDEQPGSWVAPTSPHHSCFLIDDEVLFDGILGSEILCISMLMSELMLSKRWDDHRLFPVFCYTFSAGHVRITQGCFDNSTLQLRQTDPIDIGSGISSRDNVKMLLRWMLGKPSLDTKWVVEDDLQEQQPSLEDPNIRFEIETAA